MPKKKCKKCGIILEKKDWEEDGYCIKCWKVNNSAQLQLFGDLIKW